ncbi:hypothetical protein K435DRAFT_959052 [Dendrothele bispora CBS 962.96]|uniref:BTB domain-containing protein n=1 Tax=Dendrothele bispora (strain CBS 962.96) TaxID=1314807 RepID=A0A4S8MZB2_DENBC|nr:hypothetical protein K435DRAFT_959052 [Dendrothele bispora CBS 962.96]
MIHRQRKSSLSLSNTMGWLSRSNSQPTTTNPAVHTHRSIELLSGNAKTLGTGATVVRTPDEALQDSGVRLAARKSESSLPSLPVEAEVIQYHDSDCTDNEDEDEDEDPLSSHDHESLPPPRPSRPCPTIPPVACSSPRPSRRSSLKAWGHSNRSSLEDEQQVPPLPASIFPSPPPPPFRVMLLSEVSTSKPDPSKIIVTLETCTTTYRTTLETLTSRPSHLSSYLKSLLQKSRPSSVSSEASVYSASSEDMSVYRHHLASQGHLDQSSYNIHVFLDRPSAPYAHILAYLRSHTGVPEQLESLPHSVRLQPSFSQSRLEALLDLRDEAAYLDLDDLHRLCLEEIRHRQPHPSLRSFTHTRGLGSTGGPGLGFWPTGVIHSQHASVQSLHTLVEPGQAAKEVITSSSSSSGEVSLSESDYHSVGPSIPAATKPAPMALDNSSVRSSSRSRSPPVPTPAPALVSSDSVSLKSPLPAPIKMGHTASGSLSMRYRNRSPPTDLWKGKHDSESVRSPTLSSRHRRNPSSPPAGWI